MTIDVIIAERMGHLDNNIEYFKKMRNKEIYKTIKEIEKKYENQINQLNYIKKQIENTKYLSGTLSPFIINYLVNKIEEKEYRLVTIPIKYNGKYLQNDGETYLINEFYVCGLTDDETKVEIKENEIYTEEDLNKEYEHFFRLFHYNKKLDDNILVNYLADKPTEYCNNMSSKVDSCISGKDNNYKFCYISAYIEELIEYKLSKSDFNTKLSLDEAQKIADEFIEKRKRREEYRKELLRD